MGNIQLLVTLLGASLAHASPSDPAPWAPYIPSSSDGSPWREGPRPPVSCCALIQDAVPSKLVYAGNSSYAATLSGYWSAQEGSIQPACIFQPTETAEVSQAVAILAQYPQCQFAVKGGGHTPWSGSANIQDGITFDMAGFDMIEVSDDNTTTGVGSGLRWVDVYLKLDSLDLATSGGRDADVGVAGLTLGGGESFFSPRKGFVCDNVANYELVLANGSIVNANASSNTDLFKALKGGGSNFGIITRFDLVTFPQGKLWGGAVGYPAFTAPAQFEAFAEFALSPDYDEYSSVIMNHVYVGAIGQSFFADYVVYTKPTPFPDALKVFTNISAPQTMNTLRISNLSSYPIEIQTIVQGGDPYPQRSLFVTLEVTPTAELMYGIFNISMANLATIESAVNLTWTTEMQPMPTKILALNGNGTSNVLGLSTANGNLANVLITAQWAEESDDAAVQAAAASFIEQARSYAAEKGQLSDYIYLNYAANWQDPIDGYGAENKAFLQEVSRKYDPEGLFQQQLSGGFKLFA